MDLDLDHAVTVYNTCRVLLYVMPVVRLSLGRICGLLRQVSIILDHLQCDLSLSSGFRFRI